LHTEIGPAKTTFSMVAEKAGVQRHTFYAHFPEEKELLLACSGLSLERTPLPDAGPWREIADPGERLKAGLTEIYAWFEANARLLACVLRDAEIHPGVREIMALRYGPVLRSYAEVLGAKLTAKQRPLLHLALSFHTFRTLTQDSGLKTQAAVKLMSEMVGAAKG